MPTIGCRRVPIHSWSMKPEPLPPALAQSAVLRSVIDSIPDDDAYTGDSERPIFILASGFRSGSTLVQRLVMSGEVLMWGEPFMETGWLFGLTSSLMHLPGRVHGRGNVDRKLQQGPLKDQWVANLHPGLEQLRHAHRAMIRTLLADPAKVIGHSSWGAKFVRLDGNFAHYLRWLFPNCRIIVCVRNPIESFLSYRNYIQNYAADPRKTGWAVTPNWRVNSAERFFALVHHLMGSLMAAQSENPQSMLLLRYEDVTEKASAVSALGDRLQLRLDRSVLERRLGGAFHDRAPKKPLNNEEQAAIEGWRPRFEAFGYGGAD